MCEITGACSGKHTVKQVNFAASFFYELEIIANTVATWFRKI